MKKTGADKTALNARSDDEFRSESFCQASGFDCRRLNLSGLGFYHTFPTVKAIPVRLNVASPLEMEMSEEVILVRNVVSPATLKKKRSFKNCLIRKAPLES